MNGKRYPPGPRPRFPLELLVRFRSDRLGFLLDLASYGDVSVSYTHLGA